MTAKNVATRRLGGRVAVARQRDQDGGEQFAVVYETDGAWIQYRGPLVDDRDRADFAAATLADFVGAKLT
jgi:hypothetical protein